jgi:hypothetical protein
MAGFVILATTSIALTLFVFARGIHPRRAVRTAAAKNDRAR